MSNFTKKIISSIIFSSIIGSPISSLKADTIDTISRAFSYAVAEDPTKTISGGGSQINIYKIDKTGAATLVVENLYMTSHCAHRPFLFEKYNPNIKFKIDEMKSPI